MTHICVSTLTVIGSDNGLSPGRRQAIIWTNAGILLIGPLGTNFSEILLEIYTFSFTKMHLKMSSGKWRPFCLGLIVLTCFLGKTFITTCIHNWWRVTDPVRPQLWMQQSWSNANGLYNSYWNIVHKQLHNQCVRWNDVGIMLADMVQHYVKQFLFKATEPIINALFISLSGLSKQCWWSFCTKSVLPADQLLTISLAFWNIRILF